MRRCSVAGESWGPKSLLFTDDDRQGRQYKHDGVGEHPILLETTK